MRAFGEWRGALAVVLVAALFLATPPSRAAQEEGAGAPMVDIAAAPVNDEDVASALRCQFGQYIDYDKVTSCAGDVICDRVDDVVVTYWNPDNPKEPALYVIVETEVFAIPVCRTSIQIEDQGCDSPRLFWIMDHSQSGRVAFYRT